MAQHRDNTKQAQVIDENLKRVYQDMLNQEVPDRFLDLLSQLKEQDPGEADAVQATSDTDALGRGK